MAGFQAGGLASGGDVDRSCQTRGVRLVTNAAATVGVMVSESVGHRDRFLVAFIVVIVAVGIPAVAFAMAFPQRTDYLGHYLAGAGGTLLLLTVVVAAGGRRPLVVVGVALVAVAIGVAAEATLFRLAILDPVDVANQSLGAVVVTAALISFEGSLRDAGLIAVVATLFVVAGFGFAFA